MTSFDALHTLVQSLSKAEKRYFKLFCDLQTGNKIYLSLSLAGAALWTSIVSSENFKTISGAAVFASLFFLISLIPLLGEFFCSLFFLVLGLYVLIMPPIAWFLAASLPGHWGSDVRVAFFGFLISGAACTIRGSRFFRD